MFRINTAVLVTLLTAAILLAPACAPAPAPTATPLPPTPTSTATPTETPVPPTATPVPPTATPVPPTATPVPPTATPRPTNTPTSTPVPPTATRVPATPTPRPTNTPVPAKYPLPPGKGGLVVRNWYGDTIEFSVAGQSQFIVYQGEGFFVLDPGTHSWTAHSARYGWANGSATIEAGKLRLQQFLE